MRPEGRRAPGSCGVSPLAGVARLAGMRPLVLLRAVALLVIGGLGTPVDLPAQTAKKPATATARPSARSTSRSTTRRRSSTRRRPSRPTIRAGTPIGVDSLVAHLGRVLRAAANGRWGAIVVSAETGDTLFARDADGSFLPASTMKLYTAAVALERFGPQH
ncbi:MAG: D-alanyl-D-alanine carboxypeptidase, partial [Gemmatimonadota bacterium]